MNFTAYITYSSNEEKTGKLTIQDSNGKKILSSAPVVIPKKYRNNKQINLEFELSKNVLSPQFYDYDSHLYSEISHFHGKKTIFSNTENNILFSTQIGLEKLHLDENSFVLYEDDFNKLFNIFCSSDPSLSFTFDIKPKSFMCLLDDIDTSITDICASTSSLLETRTIKEKNLNSKTNKFKKL